MFYKDWNSIYQRISKDLNLKLDKERKSADLLDKLLDKKDNFSLKKLEETIKNKEIMIFGAGPSLVNSIISNTEKIKNCVKISADGATSALIENDILPDIVVTDLDGNVSDQILANSKGSIVIVHAHGDNISNLKKFLPVFKNNLIGTTQIDPYQYKNVNNFGGFSDGDRAVFLATHFNAKKIFLIGFDYDGIIGKYSYPEKKDKKLKIKKLKWCKELIELLIKENGNIYYL